MKKIVLIVLYVTFSNCQTAKSVIVSPVKYKNIQIYEQQSNGKMGPCGPSIFISPKNTQNIVAGSVIDYVHQSLDGGNTWVTTSLESDLGVYGDPCVVADTKGNFYYFHLSNPQGKAYSSKQFLDRIVVHKSENKGKTWTNGIGIGKHAYPKQQDKEWAVVNPLNNAIYLTWTEFDKYESKNEAHQSRILFSKSIDGAKTWSDTKVLSELSGNTLDDDKTVEGAVPAVGVNGEIFVAWSYNNKIYFDKSIDEGQTWLKKDIEVCNQPGGWTFSLPDIARVNGLPITAVDLSDSNYRGTIYVNFSDQRNGIDNTDIFLVKSTDSGKTWTRPLKVNTDGTKTHQYFSWMSVDPKTGFIYIVYYDRSKYKDTQTDVVLAVSKDGGSSFVNTTISETPFVLDAKVFFGDYTNIHAYNGVIRPIWTAYYNKKLSVWTCLINTENSVRK